jgi:undecaprenyl-diphosphatase
MTFVRAVLARVSRLERWSLAGFVLAVALILSFAILASEVAEGETHGFDERLLLLMRLPGNPTVPIGPAWLKEAMRDITALGSTSVLSIIVAGIVSFLVVTGLRHAAVMVAASVVQRRDLEQSPSKRSSRGPGQSSCRDMVVYTASFPSGHTPRCRRWCI